MLETALVFGNWYGTSRDWVEERRRSGADVLLEIDWQGAAQVRAKDVGAITVQILPPSLDALEHRLRDRGQDDEASIAGRMSGASRELSHYRDFDYLVLNERFDDGPRRAQGDHPCRARPDGGAGEEPVPIPRPPALSLLGPAIRPFGPKHLPSALPPSG